MTTPTGNITIGNVASELGIGLPLALGDSRVRTFTNITSGAITLGQCRNKTRFHMVAGVNGALIGYDAGVMGSITPTADSRYSIVMFYQNDSTVHLVLVGLWTASAFSTIYINGVLLSSSTCYAIAQYPGLGGPSGETDFGWNAITNIGNGGTYDIFFN